MSMNHTTDLTQPSSHWERVSNYWLPRSFFAETDETPSDYAWVLRPDDLRIQYRGDDAVSDDQVHSTLGCSVNTDPRGIYSPHKIYEVTGILMGRRFAMISLDNIPKSLLNSVWFRYQSGYCDEYIDRIFSGTDKGVRISQGFEAEVKSK